jgi:hypothetical protein
MRPCCSAAINGQVMPIRDVTQHGKTNYYHPFQAARSRPAPGLAIKLHITTHWKNEYYYAKSMPYDKHTKEKGIILKILLILLQCNI